MHAIPDDVDTLEADNRRQLAEVEAKALRRLSEALDKADLPPAELCRFIDSYARLARIRLSQERRRAADERRAARAPARPPAPDDAWGESPRIRRGGGYDPAAPYGRDHDGRPYTRDEFHASLRRAVRGIYGLEWDPAEAVRGPDDRHNPADRPVSPPHDPAPAGHPPAPGG